MSAMDVLAVLPGEGDVKVVVKTRVRRECDNCGEPATKKLTFCYVNGRRNPASSMYGRDDCTYCSDHDAYSCDACERDVERNPPDGMNWVATFSALGRFDHMLLTWIEREATSEEAAALANVTGGVA